MLIQYIINKTIEAVKVLYNCQITEETVTVQRTNLQFRKEADYTVMVFPLVRFSKKSPEITAHELGNYLKNNIEGIENYNVMKGFLNLRFDDKYWLNFLNENASNSRYALVSKDNDQKPVLVEFASPNTNKPLHLGHIRNILLGDSISRILEATGKKVFRINLINDRGIHICKSMLAWQKWGNGETPETANLKGDFLVGKYYVIFEQNLKKQIQELVSSGMTEDEAQKNAPLLIEAQQMLKKWEEGDKQVIDLWKMMNSWVYEGFDETFESLGISFDKIYYESDTYLEGKKIIEEGLKKGILYKKDDGSVWIDLKNEGLDEKLVLRADGTSVYITQDLGTAVLRYEEYQPEKMIYIVGNEQEYHFQALKKILLKLGYAWAENIYHFSYGMVELPEGKMKSREGKVVDADDLIKEVIQTAKERTLELGKINQFDEFYAEKLFKTIGLGGLKYFILKVDPTKNMLFNPSESIDFDGNTGPFIQYTYARIQSLIKKSGKDVLKLHIPVNLKINEEERELIIQCFEFKRILQLASSELNPAQIANYTYELAKLYNQFYQKIPILKESDEHLSDFRLLLSYFVAVIIKNSMSLLGIEVPDSM